MNVLKSKYGKLLKNQTYFWSIFGYIAMFICFTIIWVNRWNLGQLYGNNNDSKVLLLVGFILLIIASINFVILKKKFHIVRWIIVVVLTLLGTLFINGILGLAFGLTTTVLIFGYGLYVYLESKKFTDIKVQTND